MSYQQTTLSRYYAFVNNVISDIVVKVSTAIVTAVTRLSSTSADAIFDGNVIIYFQSNLEINCFYFTEEKVVVTSAISAFARNLEAGQTIAGKATGKITADSALTIP